MLTYGEAYRQRAELLSQIFSKQFLFVMGRPRSGTTWLQYILDAHPEVVCRGETNIVSRFGESGILGNAVLEYNAYISKHGDLEKTFFDEEDLDYLFIQGFGLLVNHWIERSGKSPKIIGERSPTKMSLTMPTWNKLFPTAKYIHLVRDPRDVAVSHWHFELSRRPDLFDSFAAFAPSHLQRWLENTTWGHEFGKSIGDRYLEIRYEDLVADPIEGYSRLFQFLCVDASRPIVDACIEVTRFEQLSGGRSPGQEDCSAKFRKGVVGDWRNYFDEDLTEVYANRASALMRALGYPVHLD